MAGSLSGHAPGLRGGPPPALGGRRPRAPLSPRAVGLAAIALALGTGPLALLGPAKLLVLIAVLALTAAAALRPPVAAYALLATTPLLAGIERGAVLPLLRPSEAVLGVVIGGVALRGLFELARGAAVRLRLVALEWWLLAVVMTGSVIPLLWMVVRGREITTDDVLYATYVWKYALVYVVVRATIRTERQVRTCLFVSMAAAGVVAVLGVLQALGAPGVRELVGRYYAPIDYEASLEGNRGTSTLSSSFAVADVMVFNIAVACGLLFGGRARRRPMAAAIVLYVLGTVASGQFSGYAGLLIGIAVIGVVTGRIGRIAAVALPTGLVAAALLWPVISRRASNVDPISGLPVSWVGPNGRWENLTTYFWPDLFHDFNWVTGVRVAARVPAPEGWRDWVWIESGHTWLLWTGGIAFFVAVLGFLIVGIRVMSRIARERADAVAAAALGSVVALWLNVILITLDVHLTLRGSADLLFSLLALSVAGAASARASPPGPAPGDPRPAA